MTELKKWGDEAYRLLQEINGAEVRKKRITLILLADAEIAGQPKTAVFKNPRACSPNTHYTKWLHQPDYRAAYDFLIGSNDAPGIARRQRMDMLDAQEEEALAHVDESRRRLLLLSGQAVDAMQEGLTAVSAVYYKDMEIAEEPDTTNRLRAAAAIADRIPQLAKNRKTDLTVEAGEGVGITAQMLAEAQAQAAAELKGDK